MTKEKDAVVYDVPALAVAPDRPITVTGNFELVEKTLERWAARVSKMELSEDNLDEVQTIKKAAVAMRNQFGAKVEEAKKFYFNDPKEIFTARMKPITALIAKIENKADVVLSTLEQRRIDGVREVLDFYKNKFQETYKLDEQHLAQIEYPKNFFNKTADEKANKDALECQFKDLQRAQTAHVASVRLIKTSCAGEGRLNEVRYLRDLDEGKDVAAIVEEIIEEKERLRNLDNTKTVTTSTSEPVEVEVDAEVVDVAEAKRTILGVPSTLNFNTDFPGRMKTIRLEISYPCDLGDSLVELFKILKTYGIKTKVVKEEGAF